MIFAIAARDELWDGGRRLEWRLRHGTASQHGDEIVARDTADPALVAACGEAMARASAIARSIDARVRVVVRVTGQEREAETTFTVTIAGVSIVSTPEHVVADADKLRALLARTPLDQPPTTNDQRPYLWHDGSAAVLLHEAVGHPAEHDAPPVDWPSWLRVEAPLAMRRESFGDVPLLRMTHLRAWQEGAPFAMPAERVDIHRIAGGGYDPLTGVVTLHVAVPRFTIRATRAAIARALRGATGEPLRYPGVICSREGQELHVPSAAPLMVTDPL